MSAGVGAPDIILQALGTGNGNQPAAAPEAAPFVEKAMAAVVSEPPCGDGPLVRYAKHVKGGSLKGLSPTARDVYSVLAAYANSESAAWPSVKTIGEAIGRSRNVVFKAVKELVKAGLIARLNRVRRPGSNLVGSVCYRILPYPKLSPSPDVPVIHTSGPSTRLEHPHVKVREPRRTGLLDVKCPSDLSILKTTPLPPKKGDTVRASKKQRTGRKRFEPSPEAKVLVDSWRQMFKDMFGSELPVRRSDYTDAKDLLCTQTMDEALAQLKEILDEFKEFWLEYPKKQSLGLAFRAWEKLSPSVELRHRILSRLKLWKQSVDWTKDNGKYVTKPVKWLKEHRWEDELNDNGQDTTVDDRWPHTWDCSKCPCKHTGPVKQKGECLKSVEQTHTWDCQESHHCGRGQEHKIGSCMQSEYEEVRKLMRNLGRTPTTTITKQEVAQ